MNLNGFNEMHDMTTGDNKSTVSFETQEKTNRKNNFYKY